MFRGTVIPFWCENRTQSDKPPEKSRHFQAIVFERSNLCNKRNAQNFLFDPKLNFGLSLEHFWNPMGAGWSLEDICSLSFHRWFWLITDLFAYWTISRNSNWITDYFTLCLEDWLQWWNLEFRDFNNNRLKQIRTRISTPSIKSDKIDFSSILPINNRF